MLMLINSKAKSFIKELNFNFMPLFKYTTQVPTDKTIAEVQKLLIANGASAILLEYDGEGYIKALSFKLRIGEEDAGFNLPCDWRPVLKILEEDSSVPNRYANTEQAVRVGWRIINEWLKAQMAIIQTNMVKFDQVFLPYRVVKGGKTYYELSKSNNLLKNGR